MPVLFDRLHAVRALPRQARDAALRLALAHANPEESDSIAAEMLELALRRPERRLLGDVLAQWVLLSPAAREAAITVAKDRLPRVLTELRAQPALASVPWAITESLLGWTNLDATTRSQVVEWIAGAFEIEPKALEALAAAATAATTANAPDELETLDRPLALAASRFDLHRNGRVMEAVALAAANPGPALAEHLESHEDSNLLPLRAATRRMLPEAPAGVAMALLARPALAPAVIDWMRRDADEHHWASLLDHSHLLLSRSRASALGARWPGAAGSPAADTNDKALTAEQRLGRGRWGDVLSRDDNRVRRTLASALTDPSPLVRLRTVHRLATLTPNAALDELFLEFALDSDHRVASAAMTALAAAQSERRILANRDPLRRLTRSPHAAVRLIAHRLLERLAANAESDPLTSPIAASAALRCNPEWALDSLRGALRRPERGGRLAALEVALRHRLAPAIEEDVIAATHDGDTHVAAKAVLVLSRAHTRSARAALLEALGHDDRRVAANAVEALDVHNRRSGARPVDLTAFAEDDTPRVRANAINAMLAGDFQHADGINVLTQMIEDSRADHRVSGLWAAQRAGATAVADRVARMIEEDYEEHVRARAVRCGRRLLAQLNTTWSTPRAHSAAPRRRAS